MKPDDENARKPGETVAEAPPVLGGYLISVLSVVGGFAVYFLIFQLLVDPFNPAATSLHGTPVTFLWEDASTRPAAVLAADLNARYAFAVPSVLMTLTFIAAVIVAFTQVLPRFGRPAMLIGALALIAGAAIGYVEQHANPLRGVVADCQPASANDNCPLDLAVASAPDGFWFGAGVVRQVQFLVSYNSMASVAAIGLIGICALFVARAASGTAMTTGALLHRRRSIEAMLAVVGPLLAFSVATTHGFYHFSSALMVAEDAAAYTKLASAGTTYWGAVYTTVLLVVTLPASFSVVRDARRLAERALPDSSFAERVDWRKRQGVELSIREKVSLAVAGTAPVLTAPALDLLRKSFGV